MSRMVDRTPVPEQTKMSVPFFDPTPMHAAIKEDLLRDISALIDSGAFANGPAVSEFEGAFAHYCGTRACVGVASGTDALVLGLRALGLEPGEEVIVPANTFIATLEAVTHAGGVPVVVDASESDYNISVEATEAAISPRTRILLPVHLYGQLADVRALSSLASRTGCLLLEDACQAHGAERDGLRAGSIGLAAAFSFYPAKNLGAMGDAGALVTRDEAVAEMARALREHGQRRKYEHEIKGYTSRLDSIQALVLMHKLRLLDEWNADRVQAADFYSRSLSGVGDLRVPHVPKGSSPVWHLYVVRTAARAQLASFLAERGVATGRHYPQPVHLSEAYAELSHVRGAFPVAERLADELLSLPLFPGITQEQLEYVAAVVEAFFRGG